MRKLEEKYRAELVVIGVHSAKFDAERSTANIRQAVLRYGLEHPVVNDSAFEVWRRYTVRAWPTLMFIDPEGKVIGKHEGEIGFEAFDGVLQEMVRQFDERGLIDRRPVDFVTEREKQSGGPLSFPGKVLADRRSDRLFIADTNHNRVVVASADGLVRSINRLRRAGTGRRRFRGVPLRRAPRSRAGRRRHAVRGGCRKPRHTKGGFG